jgi:peroxiredoxin
MMFRKSIPTTWRESALMPGMTVLPRAVRTLDDGHFRIPDRTRLVHLQFRRFAGCPVCKLHLRSIAQRHAELVAAGVLELAVFHSTEEVMRKYQQDLPFAVAADPGRRLYVEFGVEESLRSVLDPRAWGAIARGLMTHGAGKEAGESATGLPADFMVAPDGRVLACKYGAHADDHWSVDEILTLAGVWRASQRGPKPIEGGGAREEGDLW